MKKIIIIMESLAGGGAEKVLVEMLQHLDLQKFSIDLALLVKKGIYIRDLPADIRAFGIFRSRAHFRVIKKLSKILKTDALYRNRVRRKIVKNYDVEISFLEGPSLLIHNMLRLSSARKITWVHCNLDAQRWWMKAFPTIDKARKAYSKMDTQVFVSIDARDKFNNIFHMNEMHQLIMYNPINREKIINLSTEYVVDKRNTTVCTIASLNHQKALHRVIELAAKLSGEIKDLRFWILGTGPLERELKDLAKRKNVLDTVHFLGFIENPYPYLNAADLFLSTSITEGFPLVISEAVCLGKAIVATNVTGTSEILENGKYGILTTQNIADIHASVKSVLLDPELKSHLEQMALKRSEMFDFDKSIRAFNDILEGSTI